MSTPAPSEAAAAAARLLGAARRGVALTGAGISVASGVPDFRSAGGLWARFDPAQYASIDAFIADPDRVWEMFRAADALIQRARPNPAHIALAELERLGVLRGVVTQNIDGLHQAAGSKRVVEYHGAATELHCIGCGSTYPLKRARRSPDRAPRCRCGNPLKPRVVMYGEMIPLAALSEAQALVEGADLMLVVGTSATVAPASELPLLAKAAGAKVVEFNVEPTPLSVRIADLLVQGPAEEQLPAVVALLRAARR